MEIGYVVLYAIGILIIGGLVGSLLTIVLHMIAEENRFQGPLHH
ncbi:hypothetical protein [Planomonospora venezuelensis]|uniref:Uncharacterized protein n=1 Tax=Planomonospora venezuelensis TaxID=1999 RepID=A0A841D375_PLAVE|nr:hypothetical protein [Planomonospora venezuelensis]MBB5962807.1 hypothetical protein [Planomonospora venezuelensis]GIM99397.1 hypothetical protein Pve01_10560 [Planomonospora venezuelensis]